MSSELPLLWQVPAFCPNCGASVDRSSAAVAEHPECSYCGRPLPVTPLPARLVPRWIGDSFRHHRAAIGVTAIIAVLACALSVVVVSHNRVGSQTTPAVDTNAAPRANRDHFHIAYGVYVCDHFLPKFDDRRLDVIGIHTHGDGIIHVHPYSEEVAGSAVTLAVFADAVGLQIEDGSMQLLSGGTYRDGAACSDRPAKWIVRRWEVDAPNLEPTDYRSDLAQIRLNGDRRALTIAFVPEGADIPKPPSVDNLDKVDDVAPRSSPATTRLPTPLTAPPGTSLPPSTVPIDLSATPNCSSAGRGPLPRQDGLPAAAQETRQRLADALSRCDYAALVELRASDTEAWWQDSGLLRQRNDHNLFLTNRYEAEKMVGELRTDELQGKPALATLHDALSHSYYCKTPRPDLPWAIGDAANCFWLSGIPTGHLGRPIFATTLIVALHGTWSGFQQWEATGIPGAFVENGANPEGEGPLPLFQGWVGPPPSRNSYWPQDWPRFPLDR